MSNLLSTICGYVDDYVGAIRLMTAQGVKYLSYAAGRHLQLSAIGTCSACSWCCSRCLRRGGSMDGSTGSSGDRSGVRGDFFVSRRRTKEHRAHSPGQCD